jgi:ATP-dependent Clp protease ATP-binding subunit ClpX
MFELPDRPEKDKGRFVVTPEVVRKEKSLFEAPAKIGTSAPEKEKPERKKESA